RVGDMPPAAGEAGDQVGIHRADCERAVGYSGPDFRRVPGEPGELGGGEVRVDAQAGELCDAIFVAGRTQLGAYPGGPAVLPDDRTVRRGQGGRVPDDGGLALVGDPDAADLLFVASRGEHLRASSQRRLPDLIGHLLDPAGLREILAELRVTAT